MSSPSSSVYWQGKLLKMRSKWNWCWDIWPDFSGASQLLPLFQRMPTWFYASGSIIILRIVNYFTACPSYPKVMQMIHPKSVLRTCSCFCTSLSSELTPSVSLIIPRSQGLSCQMEMFINYSKGLKRKARAQHSSSQIWTESWKCFWLHR